MPNVGYATIQVIPSLRGIGSELRRQLVVPAGDAGGQAGEAAGGSLKEKLAVGAAAAGAAAGALLVAGLTEAMEQANITSTLQAQLGATGKDASRYGKAAGELYSKGITDSFEQGAEAIRAVVNAGLVSPDATNAQLESISAKMSDVASTFGVDMSLQTQAVAAMFKNGVAPSAEAALDLITVGFQKLGPNAEDLLETFQEYSIQFKKLGITGEEALGLFRQGITAGARDTDIIADAFKEFGIRAIDMSQSSQDAYKAIGLDAEQMSLQIAKGGDIAGEGLQLVLDKLRAIEDPVARNAAAVGLFGTQAEDLGAALFKLDPKAAVGSFGAVAGAAADLGKTIHSGPSYELTVFTRSLKQGFVEFIGGQVLPVIIDVAHWLRDNLPTAIRATGDAVSAIVRWFRDWGLLLSPLVVLVGALAAEMVVSAVAAAAEAAAILLVTGVMRTAGAITKGFAAAQAVLNAVLALNPITLVVIALVALAAGLVVAYQKSETFRAIVQGAWAGIQVAAAYAWAILKPIFLAIGNAVVELARIFLTIFIIPTYLALKLLAPVFTWLWKEMIKPAFDGIAAGAKWLWQNGIKPAFDSFMAQARLVGAAAMWLWQNAIKPAWDGMGNAIKWVWQNWIKPAFDALSRGVGNVRDSFSSGVDGIGRIWDKLRDLTRKPVQFMIDTVYNNGIRKVWNTVADFTGAGKLGVVNFADGGRTYGGTPGKDSIPIMAMADEYMVKRDSARRVGYGTLEYINRYGALPGFASGGQVQGYKDGGIIGSIGGLFGDLTDLITNPGKAWQSATGAIRDKLSSITGTGYGKLIAGIPTKMLSTLKDKIVSAMSSFGGGGDIGGSGVQRWAPIVLQALAMVGQPASMLATTLRRMNQESGGNPFAINNWDSNAQAGDPSRGLMQTIGSTFNAYAGGLRSRGIYDPLANIYASMRYALATYGSLPRAYDRAGGYDSGGWLQPGLTLAHNATGQPEAVLTAEQWRGVTRGGAGRGDQRQYHITLQGSQMTAAEQAAELVRHMQFVT